MTRPVSRRAFAAAAFTFAVAAAAASGCGGRYREATEPPQIQARVAQFAGADANAVSLRLEMTVYNPNAHDLWADSLNATLTVAGQQVGGARVTFAQVLPAQRPLPIVANVAVARAGLVAMAQMQAAALGPQLAAGGADANGAMIPFSIAGTMELAGRRRHQRMVVPFTMNGQFPAQVIIALAAGGPVPASAEGMPATSGGAAPEGGMTGGPSAP